MNYSRNKKYFLNDSATKLPIKPIIIGVIVSIIFLSIEPIIGLLGLALVGGYIYLWNKNRISDEQIDQEYQKGLDNLKEEGLDKLGLDEEQVSLIEPIIISGPLYRRIASSYYVRKGNDDFTRSSNYEAVVLYFSENQVFAYQKSYSIINKDFEESTDEYFYKDIVSIRTSKRTFDLEDKKDDEPVSVQIEEFKLTTTGGTSISSTIWQSNKVNQQIKAMQALLREKKNA